MGGTPKTARDPRNTRPSLEGFVENGSRYRPAIDPQNLGEHEVKI